MCNAPTMTTEASRVAKDGHYACKLRHSARHRKDLRIVDGKLVEVKQS